MKINKRHSVCGCASGEATIYFVVSSDALKKILFSEDEKSLCNLLKKIGRWKRGDRFMKQISTSCFQELCAEVKKALINLQTDNSVISMNRVKKLLPRKWNDTNFKKAYRSITEEMNLRTEK